MAGREASAADRVPSIPPSMARRRATASVLAAATVPTAVRMRIISPSDCTGIEPGVTASTTPNMETVSPPARPPYDTPRERHAEDPAGSVREMHVVEADADAWDQ